MRLLTAVFLTGTVWGVAGGPERAPLIEQALDQTMRFRVTDAPVLEAFAALTKETGVNIAVAPETLDLLPYGPDTKVSVVLENLRLREGLAQLLMPLGMAFEPTADGVQVRPTAALLRIGRRATWEELDQLKFARSADWAKLALDAAAMRQHVQFRVAVGDPAATLGSAAARLGAGPGDQVLTLACESLQWTWYPEGDKIVVLTASDQLRRQLEARVSLRLTHRPLIDVLQQLGQQAHVRIEHEPGVIASLPVQTRQNFSLLVEGTTVREALEQVAAATGLGYRVDGTQGAVVFYYPGPASAGNGGPSAAPAPTPSRDPIVAKLTVAAEPGKPQLEVLIRESELSPEALKARSELVRQADEILRLELKDKKGQ
jgi:hypothetical protein